MTTHSLRRPVPTLVVVVVTIVLSLLAFYTLALLMVAGDTVAPFAFLIALALMALVSELCRKVELSVGADGIVLRGALSTRFFRYEEVETVAAEHHRLRLKLRGKAPLLLEAVSKSTERASDIWNLAARIHQGRSTTQSHAHDLEAVLKRGDRTVGQWLQDVRTLTGQEVGYRDASIDDDKLWSVVEDASLDSSQRTAAGIALRDHLDARGKLRLRVAADASASPQVRVALEAVLGAADDELVRVLERL